MKLDLLNTKAKNNILIMKILKPLFYKSIRIKLLFFSFHFFTTFLLNSETLVSSSIIPEKFSDYKDSDDAL